jgi:hypothetical protein
MKRSRPPTRVSAAPARGLEASGSSQRQSVLRRFVASSRQPSGPSGMSLLNAQALLTYLRGAGVCDACAIELVTYCARRAREAN